jgi:hypothetical protein
MIELFTKTIVKKLLKIWSWDPEKTYSGSRIQGSKRHRIPDPDPQHCPGPTLTKARRKKILPFCSRKFHKFKILLFFNKCGTGTEKILAN